MHTQTMMADTNENTVIVSTENNEPSQTNGSVKPSFENGQLSYLGHDVESIPKSLIEDYCNISHRFDLSFNRLQSLKGLEHFKFLKELVLDNNDLDDSVYFPPLRDLQTLTVNKNRLKDLTSLMEQFRVHYPNLTYLSLLGNQACPNQLSSLDKDDEDYQRYRYFVIYKLQKLKFLDSSQVTAIELAEAKRVGPFMQVVRPKVEEAEPENETSEPASPDSKYTPLPSSDSGQKEVSHQGFFGRNKSKYLGNNSEGNRFITDGIL